MGKKTIAIVGAGVAAAGVILLVRHKKTPAPPPSPPAPQPGYANIYGKVQDSDDGKSIAGVEISCDGITTTSDSNGDYRLTDIEPQGYTLEASKEGYYTASVYTAPAEGNNELNIVLIPIPATSPPVDYLILHCTGVISRQAANRNDPPTSHWSVNLYDPVTKTWEGGDIKKTSEPQILHPKGSVFILHVYEWYGPYSYGPFLVKSTQPLWGDHYYRADPSTGTFYIDGVKLPRENRSYVHGTYLETVHESGYYWGRVRINTAEDVPGWPSNPVLSWDNWAKYFEGTVITIQNGYPERTGSPVGPNGEYDVMVTFGNMEWGKMAWIWVQT
jgi:hypothetical protein